MCLFITSKSYGLEACHENKGTIGDGSCIYDGSCFRNKGNVTDGSCSGLRACLNNEGGIGKDSWYVFRSSVRAFNNYFIYCILANLDGFKTTVFSRTWLFRAKISVIHVMEIKGISTKEVA